MNKVTIGLTGEKRAGKGSFQNIVREVLRKHGVLSVAEFSTSEAIAKTLKEYGVLESRLNRAKFAVMMDSNFGSGCITHRVFNIAREDRSTVKMIDSIRWLADEEALRREGNGLLLYITADPKVRWERAKLGSDKPDDQKMTYEEFLEKEDSPTEILIREIGARADWKIENNGTREELQVKIEEFAEKKVMPMLNKEE